jgi:mannitol-1-phosphate 5-dehydrogenase
MSETQNKLLSQLPNPSSNPSTEIDDDMPLKPKAIQFGAGNIGRGFIAPLLSGAGYTVVFADVNQHIVDSLNEEKSYEIHVLDQEQYQFSVDDVMGVLSTTDDVVRAIADPNAHIITTAVGVNILDRIAPTIAKGLIQRREIGGDVMNIIACENTIGATSILKDRVYKALESDVDRAWVTEHIGFADCSVDRIVPPFDREEHDANKLDVGVERFYEWVVCGSALKRPLPPVKGWKLTDNLPSYNERKLFTLNAAHATTAYLGYLKGKTTIEKAILDEEIHKAVHDALEESGAALCKKHGFEPREHKAYIATIIER